MQYLPGRILAMPEVNQKLPQHYDLVRLRFVSTLRQALPESEIVWRYYWMGGCVMCSPAIDPALAAGLAEHNWAKADAESLVVRIFPPRTDREMS